ncbi:alpha/beta hydrolase [Alphaproteobacteria bacterium]|nr:alpha/beta hydrolase [Alphaproteobacteria bacterium]
MNRKQISIALQGGGVQSAFAWGVLDFFLNDGRLDITGISSTGLGGMAGAALMQGLITGSNNAASAMLREYWIGMNNVSKKMAPFISNPLERIVNYYNFSETNDVCEMKGISPYDKNPLNINPLLDFIDSFFDFNIINEEKNKKIFISSTHVETGKIKVFSNDDMCAQVLMASFCLPHVFHSVEIDGEHYWDGGMVANPAINPLINGVSSMDIVVIQLSKTACFQAPKSYADIENRIREINYNAHLLREMRAIYFISNLIDSGKIEKGSLKRINMHVVRNESYNFKNVGKSGNFCSDWGAIMNLYTEGFNTAKKWLGANFENIETEHSSLSDEIFGAYV